MHIISYEWCYHALLTINFLAFPMYLKIIVFLHAYWTSGVGYGIVSNLLILLLQTDSLFVSHLELSFSKPEDMGLIVCMILHFLEMDLIGRFHFFPLLSLNIKVFSCQCWYSRHLLRQFLVRTQKLDKWLINTF